MITRNGRQHPEPDSLLLETCPRGPPFASFIHALDFATVVKHVPKTKLTVLILNYYVCEDAHQSEHLSERASQ
jgi:hypothetical protein